MGNLVCVACLRPLRERPPQTALRVVFPTGELSVAAGAELVLGRDPTQSPAAATFAGFDNVSRRHAILGLDQEGGAWVRDEHSTNGTFVNERRVPPGKRIPLNNGDAIRLAADATGHIRV